MYKIISPLRVPKHNITTKVSKQKPFTLNLNGYRNEYPFSLNNSKIHYKNIIDEQVAKLPFMNKVKITYTLYPKTKRLTDLGNVIAIHQKYFEDALVEGGKLTDDNYLYVVENRQLFGEVDPNNPRVEILIEEVE